MIEPSRDREIGTWALAIVLVLLVLILATWPVRGEELFRSPRVLEATGLARPARGQERCLAIGGPPPPYTSVETCLLARDAIQARFYLRRPRPNVDTNADQETSR